MIKNLKTLDPHFLLMFFLMFNFSSIFIVHCSYSFFLSFFFLCDVKVLCLMLNNNVDIQAQFHKIYDEKVQAHEVKNEIQDGIQDLSGSMTRKKT